MNPHKERKSLYRNALTVTLSVASLASWAEDVDENHTQISDSTSATVTILGDQSDLLGMPGAAHYIDSAALNDDHSGDINRVLRQVPGVYVREEDGYGLFPNISLRGADTTRSAKVTLLEDGILTAPAPYSAPAAYYSPMVGRMHALEVRKGSSQTSFGPHTTGGVINYVSTPIPSRFAGQANFSYGTDNSVQAHIHTGTTYETTQAGTIGAMVELAYAVTDGYKELDSNNDPAATDDTGYERIEPTLKLAWEPASTLYQRFEFSIGLSDIDANISYLGLTEADFADDPYQRYAASRYDNFDAGMNRQSLRYIIEPNELLSLTTTLYAQNFNRNWFKLHALRDIDLGSGTVIGAMALSDALIDPLGIDALRGERAATLRYRHNNRDYRLYGLSVDGIINSELAGVEHELRAGFRVHHDYEERFQQDIDFVQNTAGIIEETNPVSLPGFAGNRRQETTAVSAYIEDQIFLDRWRLVAGLRIESLDYSYEIKPPENPSAGDDTLLVISGGVGAAYRINPSWTVFTDLFRGVSTPTPLSYIRDGSTEETSIAFELGARWQDQEHPQTKADVVFFASLFQDLLVIDNIGGTGTGASENIGEVVSIGIESSVQFDIADYQQWTVKNPWRLAATVTDATLNGDANSTDGESIFAGGEDGNAVPYIPQLVLSVSSKLSWKRWGVGISVQYQAETYSTASNSSDNTTPAGNADARFGKTDDYLLVDFDTWYKLTDYAKVFAGLNNAFDQEYVASRHPHGPRPGRPLYAFVGTELSW